MPPTKDRLAEIDREISRIGVDPAQEPPTRRRGSVVPISEQVRAVAAATGDAYEALKAEVERSVAEGRAIVEVDARTIDETAWRDRDETAYADEAFRQLVRSIEEQGQIAPVTLRPLPGGRHEVVFGHRRVRACRALRRPVRAIVVPLGDKELLSRMITENAVRQDLSPLEKARAWRRLLDSKTFTRQDLAKLLQVTPQQVSNVLALGMLPEPVVEALGDWRTLSILEGKRLLAAVEERAGEIPPAVLERVRGSVGTASHKAKLLQAALRAEPRAASPPAGGRLIKDRRGRKLARLSQAGAQLVLRFQSDLDPRLVEALADRLPELLERIASEQPPR